MPPAKQPSKQPKASKRQHRPRLDAVLRHIENGSYDEEIEQILAAVETRRASRQEAVLKMVKQVYGEDFDVAPKQVLTRKQVSGEEFEVAGSSESLTFRQPTTHRPNPFASSGDTSQTDEWIEAERRAREQEEALARGDDKFDDDDVSNSPVIGSIDVSAPPAGDQET